MESMGLKLQSFYTNSERFTKHRERKKKKFKKRLTRNNLDGKKKAIASGNRLMMVKRSLKVS